MQFNRWQRFLLSIGGINPQKLSAQTDIDQFAQQHRQHQPTASKLPQSARDHYECHDSYTYRIIELTAAQLIGRSFELRTDSEIINNWIAAWWNDPRNKIQQRLLDYTREILIAGEIIFLVYPNKITGMQYIRAIPQSMIEEITPYANDFDRIKSLRINNTEYPDAGDGLSHQKRTVGYHYAINRALGCLRSRGGVVDASIKSIDRYEQWLDSRAEMSNSASAYAWDIQATNVERLEELRKDFSSGTIPTGSIFIHTEGETLKPINNNISSNAGENDGNAMLKAVAAGSMTALHLLADPEGTTQATSKAITMPIYTYWATIQGQIATMWQELAMICMNRSGMTIPPFKWTTRLSDLNIEDNSIIANAMNQAMQATDKALDLGIITKDEAHRIFIRFSSEYNPTQHQL
jgi:hypothetical protein